ncbi:MAG: hypothetical protein KF752_09780 [Pirellulaceae bacterium]|nr:hypothetical protein [Pirellulaceae bacterium]
MPRTSIPVERFRTTGSRMAMARTVIILFVCLVLFVHRTAEAQSLESSSYGSASELKGNVYTLSIFISKDGRESWGYREKLEVLRKQEEAMTWIRNQALNYGVKVNFDAMGSYGLEDDIKVSTIDRGTASGNEPSQWVSRMLYRLGYKSTHDLVEWVHSNINAMQIQVLIYAKGRGRSYAMSSSNGVNEELYFVEGAIVYEQDNSGNGVVSSVIAHEILHLYGAWDLYETLSQSAENEERARRLFPSSIMRRIADDINELEVDEVSAWLVGWKPNRLAWYEALRPKRR